MTEATSLGTFETRFTKAPEAANGPGWAGELTALAKGSRQGLLGAQSYLCLLRQSFDEELLLFPGRQWIRGKSFLRSKIFPPRWRINRRQIPMSHSSPSLLIVLGTALPPSCSAIGLYQGRTSLFCLIKFYCFAFQNNNSYTGTWKARKAHKQEKTCLRLVKATRIVA